MRTELVRARWSERPRKSRRVLRAGPPSLVALRTIRRIPGLPVGDVEPPLRFLRRKRAKECPRGVREIEPELDPLGRRHRLQTLDEFRMLHSRLDPNAGRGSAPGRTGRIFSLVSVGRRAPRGV